MATPIVKVAVVDPTTGSPPPCYNCTIEIGVLAFETVAGLEFFLCKTCTPSLAVQLLFALSQITGKAGAPPGSKELFNEHVWPTIAARFPEEFPMDLLEQLKATHRVAYIAGFRHGGENGGPRLVKG